MKSYIVGKNLIIITGKIIVSIIKYKGEMPCKKFKKFYSQA